MKFWVIRSEGVMIDAPSEDAALDRAYTDETLEWDDEGTEAYPMNPPPEGIWARGIEDVAPL